MWAFILPIWLMGTLMVMAASLVLLISGDMILKEHRVAAAKMLLFCWAWPVLLVMTIAKQMRIAMKILFDSEKKQ